jgi:hypothetical protein
MAWAPHHLVAIAICAAAVAGDLAAQGGTTPATGSVAGEVLSKDNAVVPDAVIVIAGRIARTDSAGRFVIRGVPLGEHELVARRIGFEPVTRRVQVTVGQPVQVRMVLNEVIHRLQAMQTIGQAMAADGRLWMLDEFDRRRRRGVGVFLSREDLKYFYSIGSAVAGRTPGVREVRDQFGNWSFVFTRCGGAAAGGRVAVFIDGMRAYNGADALSFYRPSDVEAIEIYRSVAELPPEAVGDGCAAIFIWLRRS